MLDNLIQGQVAGPTSEPKCVWHKNPCILPTKPILHFNKNKYIHCATQNKSLVIMTRYLRVTFELRQSLRNRPPNDF